MLPNDNADYNVMVLYDKTNYDNNKSSIVIAANGCHSSRAYIK